MPIVSISQQPTTNQLLAAYRPVYFRVVASATGGAAQPPVVICDVYVNGVFYKSHAKTQPANINVSNSEWEFDISDSIQEILESNPSQYAGSIVYEQPTTSAKIFCRFRSSGFDSNGFIKVEGTAPVQATSNSPASSGTGTESNSFYVINVALQNEVSEPLESHLQGFKNGTWSVDAFPLTTRPKKYFIGRSDNDFFRIFDRNKSCYSQLALRYRRIGQTGFQVKYGDLPQGICETAITSLTVSQSGAAIIVSWEYSGTPEGFKYSFDGGVWFTTSESSISVSSLSNGGHSVTVVPFCNCTEGTGSTQEFTKIPPEEICTASLEFTSGVQTSPTSITFDWTETGSPTSYRYRIDGGSWITTMSKPLVLTLAAGSHFIELVPRCSNGSLGSGDSGGFTVSTVAQYSITEFNPANGNHKIQRTFDDGKTAIHYRVFCSATLTHQGPFTATFGVGVLLSSTISGSGPHCATAMSDITFTP